MDAQSEFNYCQDAQGPAQTLSDRSLAKRLSAE